MWLLSTSIFSDICQVTGVRDISYLLFPKKNDYSTFKCYNLKNLNGPKKRLYYFSFLSLWFWAERDPFLTGLRAHISNKQEKCSFPWPILSIMSELFWAVLFCSVLAYILYNENRRLAGGRRLTLSASEVRRVLSVPLSTLSAPLCVCSCIMDEMIHNLLSLLYLLKPMNNGRQPTCLFALEISEKRSNESSGALIFLPYGYLFLFAKRLGPLRMGVFTGHLF